MARLKRFGAYKRLDRPYTRRSKYRQKSYIRVNPNKLIVKFNMGNTKKDFPYHVSLISKEDMQIRQNALESARMACNRLLERSVGKVSYNFQVRPYPHHILRENPLAAGAGADRLSTGMAHAFGKPIGIAVRIREGQEIFSLRANKGNLLTAKKALKKASQKLPGKCTIAVEEFIQKQ